MKTTVKYSILLLILLATLASCGKRKELAENTTKEFFEALKNDNTTKMNELYPNFGRLKNHYKSDKITIKETKVIDDKTIAVTVDNSFMNNFGKSFNQNITLFLKEDENDKNIYKIYDSKGLAGYEDDESYTFALRTGAIPQNSDLTDIETTERLETTSDMMAKFGIDFLLELQSLVKVTSWDWELGYGGSASGRGIVRNGSDFNITKLKYKVRYFDKDDMESTSDDGYISYDAIPAGGSKSFTFFTSYAGNARTARLTLDFDTDQILEYILKKQYKGNEYIKYLENKEEEESKKVEEL